MSLKNCCCEQKQRKDRCADKCYTGPFRIADHIGVLILKFVIIIVEIAVFVRVKSQFYKKMRTKGQQKHWARDQIHYCNHIHRRNYSLKLSFDNI